MQAILNAWIYINNINHYFTFNIIIYYDPHNYSSMNTQQTQNICITFVQRRPNVYDVGPTLYKSYTNVLCLLGILILMYIYKTPIN